MPLTKTPQWVALYTAPRVEKAVTERIVSELHLEAYLPLHRVLRRWSDRMKLVEVPLITSYTFVKMCERDIIRVHNLQGVSGFVTFRNSGIATIPDAEMKALRRMAESMEAVYVRNTDQLRKGARVRVSDGVFQGMEGTIVSNCDEGNFAVLMSNLNISLVAHIEPDILQVVS